jgi:uncharacterized protein (TIGR02118 family)
MIKLMTFLKRRAPMTRAELQVRWMDVHAPLALEFPGLRGYMLSFSIDRTREPTADAVAQLWFDSREACQASYASDIGRNGSADANAYLSRRDQMLASEEWLVCDRSLEGLPFKYQIGAKRREGVSREDFVAWWRGDFADAVRPHCSEGMGRLCFDEAGVLLNSGTTGELSLRAGEAPFDGMFETWFATPEALLAAVQAGDVAALCEPHASALEVYALGENVMRLPPPPAYGRTASP